VTDEVARKEVFKAKMLIRNGTEADLNEVMDLVASCPPLVLYDDFTYWVLLRFFGDCCLVFEEDQSIVGYVSGVASTKQEGVFYLWQIAIDPQHRGKRYAASLIGEMIRIARDKTCHSFQFSIAPDNEISLRVFSRISKEGKLPMSPIGKITFIHPATGRKEIETLFEFKI